MSPQCSWNKIRNVSQRAEGSGCDAAVIQLWGRAEECTIAECGGNAVEEHTTMRDDMHACQGNGKQWNCPGIRMMASVLL